MRGGSGSRRGAVNPTAEVWENVATDPDPHIDLGYEIAQLTVIHVEEGGEKYLFLPGEEEHLYDAEFIVATPDSVRLLGECQ